MRDWLILGGRNSPPPPSMDRIVEAVCVAFDVPRQPLLSDWRRRKFSRPRLVAYWLSLLDGTRSTPMVGRYFARDHTSIIYGRNRVEKAIADGSPLGLRAQQIARELGLFPVEIGEGLAHVKQSAREAA